MSAYVLAETVLAESGHTELPIPAIWIGVLAFVGLLALLGVTLAIGRGRPHS